MTSAALPHRPFFETSGIRFRLWPIVLVALAIEPLLMPGREPARWLYKAIDGSPTHAWLFGLLACVFQGIVGGILASG